MAFWYFSPFIKNGISANGPIQLTYNKYRRKGAVLVDPMVEGSLRRMLRSDVLIIAGHSQFRDPTLYERSDGTGDSYTCEEIIAMLRLGDLNPLHVRIRFLACESAALAVKTAVTLGTTHQRIAVGGYRMKISVFNDGTRTWCRTTGTTYIQNWTDSGAISWYNANGQLLNGKPLEYGGAFDPELNSPHFPFDGPHWPNQAY